MTEHCLTAFFDVNNKRYWRAEETVSSWSVCITSRLEEMACKNRHWSLTILECINSALSVTFQLFLTAFLQAEVPHTWTRWLTWQFGFLKLLISQSILSGPLDFEIKGVACNAFYAESKDFNMNWHILSSTSPLVWYLLFDNMSEHFNSISDFRSWGQDVLNSLVSRFYPNVNGAPLCSFFTIAVFGFLHPKKKVLKRTHTELLSHPAMVAATVKLLKFGHTKLLL